MSVFKFQVNIFIADLNIVFVLVGALMGFTLARFQYLDNRGDFCKRGNAAPGECFYYLQQTRYHVGIILHLGCILRKLGSYLLDISSRVLFPITS